MIEQGKVKETMATLLKQPVAKMEDGTVLTDLVTDSFLLVEMVIELQGLLGVRLVQADLNHVKTVGDLTQVVVAKGEG